MFGNRRRRDWIASPSPNHVKENVYVSRQLWTAPMVQLMTEKKEAPDFAPPSVLQALRVGVRRWSDAPTPGSDHARQCCSRRVSGRKLAERGLRRAIRALESPYKGQLQMSEFVPHEDLDDLLKVAALAREFSASRGHTARNGMRYAKGFVSIGATPPAKSAGGHTHGRSRRQ